MSRVLNECFTSIFTQENEDDGVEFSERDCEVLEQIDIGKDKVLEVFAALKVDKSPQSG